ncbi:hypothetical protein G3T14_15400 [Methylobacterium sp. BTF04]|uniref:hypothetical protein n=1 Tax=Methylobacterium sp. BTF04 TaxID=2708300 RepID=UPI0013D0CD08|nr:hypothetical protein [Methylobacterium sp. BTF04]NEU13507.1 hypothetical protein [Methylobacterium sp. BTF04]
MSDPSHTAMKAAFDAEVSQAAKEAAFTAALVAPTPWSERDWLGDVRWPLFVDTDIQAIFGNDEALGAHELAPRWAELMRCKWLAHSWNMIPKGTVILGHWVGAASLMHWGARFELVAQVDGPDGQPRWRRVRTEPSFVVDPTCRWRIVRVRGLEPEAQAAQYARERKRAKSIATWDRKARDKADTEIADIVAAMVKVNPNFVAGDDHSIRKRLPEICHTRTIAQVAPMIADAHQRLMMNRDDLATWKRHLADTESIIRARLTRIERGTGPGVLRSLEDLMGPAPRVHPAVLPADASVTPAEKPPDIPDEDAAALQALAI